MVGQKGLFEVGDVHYKKAVIEVKQNNKTKIEVPNKKTEVCIPKENHPFFKMDWKEKIASQLFQGNQAFLSDIPRACQAQENDEWIKNKAEESKHAISETIIFMRNLIMEINFHCDDEDSDKSTDMSLGAG